MGCKNMDNVILIRELMTLSHGENGFSRIYKILFTILSSLIWVGDECSDDFNDLDATDLISSIDEKSFKIFDFPTTYIKKCNDGGRPTEIGLVDVYGKASNLTQMATV